MNGTTGWALLGVLLASTALNVLNVAGSARGTAPASAAEVACVDALDLTDAQRMQLQGFDCGACCAAIRELEGRTDDTVRALQEALAQPSIDTAEVRRLTGELARLRARRVESTLEAIVRVRGILDPDQLRALEGCFAVCR